MGKRIKEKELSGKDKHCHGQGANRQKKNKWLRSYQPKTSVQGVIRQREVGVPTTGSYMQGLLYHQSSISREGQRSTPVLI